MPVSSHRTEVNYSCICILTGVTSQKVYNSVEMALSRPLLICRPILTSCRHCNSVCHFLNLLTFSCGSSSSQPCLTNHAVWRISFDSTVAGERNSIGSNIVLLYDNMSCFVTCSLTDSSGISQSKVSSVLFQIRPSTFVTSVVLISSLTWFSLHSQFLKSIPASGIISVACCLNC